MKLRITSCALLTSIMAACILKMEAENSSETGGTCQSSRCNKYQELESVSLIPKYLKFQITQIYSDKRSPQYVKGKVLPVLN
jgi:hypothetical protein